MWSKIRWNDGNGKAIVEYGYEGKIAVVYYNEKGEYTGGEIQGRGVNNRIRITQRRMPRLEEALIHTKYI